MKKLAILAVAVVAVALTAGVAHAYTFDMGAGSSIDACTSDPGLVLHTQVMSTLDSVVYDLEEGESATFLFAKIWTEEGAVNSDDMVAKQITALVHFDNPSMTQPVQGTSQGVFTDGWWFFDEHGYDVVWNDPVTVAMAGNGEFEIELTDIHTSQLFDLPNYKQRVYATVTLNSAPVPEPATMALFGLGLVGLATRRKK